MITGLQVLTLVMVVVAPVLVVVGLSMMRSQEVGSLFTLQSQAQQQHPSKQPEMCMGGEIQEEIRAVMLKAIDKALEQHTIHVFDVWLRDPSDQPKRAIEGMRIGISAYLRTRRQVDKWDPPDCPP